MTALEKMLKRSFYTNVYGAKDEMLRVAVEALRKLNIAHDHPTSGPYTSQAKDNSVWCILCVSRVPVGHGIAEEALLRIEALAGFAASGDAE